MNASDKALDNAVEVIAGSLQPTDPRLWKQLLVYAPEWVVLDRARKIRQREEQMKLHPCEPRSEAWYELRRGIPCTSGFQYIITPLGAPTTGERRMAYMHRLIAERLLGYSMEKRERTYWTERGGELEPEAARAFAKKTGCEFVEGSVFITNDAGTLGCSPDYLILGAIAGARPWRSRPRLPGPRSATCWRVRGASTSSRSRASSGSASSIPSTSGPTTRRCRRCTSRPNATRPSSRS